MQDLTALLLAYGGLLVGYGIPIVTYIILRRKAQRQSAGRRIIQIRWWRSFSWLLSGGMLVGAASWTAAIASLFAHLVSSLDEICPSLITQEECSRAASDWETACVVLVEMACAAFIIIVRTTYKEAKSTERSAERSHPLVILACSHWLLVVSWLLTSPLTYPQKLFSLIGTNHWTSASSAFAICAILTYILGSTLWIIGFIRIFCAWRRKSRNRTRAGAQRSVGPERDIALEEVQS